MLPEFAAAPDHVLPQPRLALVHAGRSARVQRRTLKGGLDALLVHCMTGLMQGREQRLADVVLAHARGDAHVARGKLGAEWMVRLVDPPALKVVAHALDDGETERHLRRFRERSGEAAC